jgi:hypothetical protein
MSPVYSAHAAPPATLADRLARLGLTLDALGADLRGGVARALSEAVAGAVRQALQAALGDAPQAGPAPARWEAASYRRTPLWGGAGEGRRWDDPYGDPAPEDDGDWLPRGLPASGPGVYPSPRSARRWGRAVAVGLEASALSLRRPGKRPALAALGWGVATGLVALVAGPLATAGLGLAGAALDLAAASDVAHAAAGLAGPRRP